MGYSYLRMHNLSVAYKVTGKYFNKRVSMSSLELCLQTLFHLRATVNDLSRRVNWGSAGAGASAPLCSQEVIVILRGRRWMLGGRLDWVDVDVDAAGKKNEERGS